jgi:hypothetical protein
MKTKIFFILLVMWTCVAGAQTETVPVTTTNTASLTEQTLNEVMIQMLSGVKNASGEIYTASKDMLRKGVDFVSEQAPDVVKQFLHWKLAEHILNGCLGLLATSLGFYLGYRFKRYGQKKHDEFPEIFGWFCQIISVVIALICVGKALYPIIKITVAPKVYLLEYFVSVIK